MSPISCRSLDNKEDRSNKLQQGEGGENIAKQDNEEGLPVVSKAGLKMVKLGLLFCPSTLFASVIWHALI